MNLKPATKFITNSPWQQFFHILSELCEVAWEIWQKDWPKVAEELVDLQVSCQTLLAILGYTGDKYSTLKRIVMDKNEKRHYYDSPSV